MEFEWDENKAAMNLAKHGIPFEYAARVFLDPYRLEEEELIEFEEEVRRRVIGMVDDRVLLIVYTEVFHELESSLPGEQRVMSEENTTKFRLDEKSLPRLSKSQARRLDSMSDEDIEQAALSDPDNLPLTDEELAAFERVPDTKAIRKALRLTQREFAATFQLSLATVRDWEQGRYQPDQAARTLLRVIARDPKSVKRALEMS